MKADSAADVHWKGLEVEVSIVKGYSHSIIVLDESSMEISESKESLMPYD